ncbi:MAG TPA: hypothetical protein VFB60_04770 [Ktedonobacteraceae bacterium]|nr:hypothetical protein [Ktedonobacteraceae bacterium]
MFKRPAAIIILICLALFVLAGCGNPDNVGASGNPGTATLTPAQATPTAQPTSSPPGNPAQAPFSVTSIDMAVSPASIAGMACGTSINVVYTATFHAPANSPGGTVQFVYTTNNGRSTPRASIAFAPGETVKTYAFSWSGTLYPDNVNPGLGGVVTNAPNAVSSPTVKPTGTCALAAPFQVTSIDLAVTPSSIAGSACNSSITLNYTVTFHIAPYSPGGMIQFAYSTNNGRSQTNASTVVDPTATTKTFTFTTSGTLYPDHTFPGVAIVMVTSPNNLISSGVSPSGACS